MRKFFVYDRINASLAGPPPRRSLVPASSSTRRNRPMPFSRSCKARPAFTPTPSNRRRTSSRRTTWPRQMATAPQSLYSVLHQLGRLHGLRSRPTRQHLWQLAAVDRTREHGSRRAAAYRQSSVPPTGQISGYSTLEHPRDSSRSPRRARRWIWVIRQRQQPQTLGTIRANAPQREADIASLEPASHSSDPSQQTEIATLQRINQALLIQLRTQQETNQIDEA